MSNKTRERLDPVDRDIRALPIPAMRGMFDGVVLTIELRRGFEIFNTRPYHNYEDWGDGYTITMKDPDYGGLVVSAEDLDDAVTRLREAMLALIREKQGPLTEAPYGAWYVIPDLTKPQIPTYLKTPTHRPAWILTTVMRCAREEQGGRQAAVAGATTLGRGFHAKTIYDRRNEDGSPHSCDACKEEK